MSLKNISIDFKMLTEADKDAGKDAAG